MKMRYTVSKVLRKEQETTQEQQSRTGYRTLMNFLKLRKLKVRGITNVHKVMLLAVTAYNLKKYMSQMCRMAKTAVIPMRKAAINSNNFLQIPISAYALSTNFY